MLSMGTESEHFLCFPSQIDCFSLKIKAKWSVHETFNRITSCIFLIIPTLNVLVTNSVVWISVEVWKVRLEPKNKLLNKYNLPNVDKKIKMK